MKQLSAGRIPKMFAGRGRQEVRPRHLDYRGALATRARDDRFHLLRHGTDTKAQPGNVSITCKAY
jgi:hypothetical protein